MESPTFIILGATGDLTKRKLIPAIYHLVEKNKIKNFGIVGAARSDYSAKQMISDAKKFIKNPNQKILKNLESRTDYIKLDFYDPKDYDQFRNTCLKVERKFKLPKKRIFYLATLPDHFESIAKNLKKVHMCDKIGSWPRLAFEKPFGHNLSSAKKINKTLKNLFPEKQIYRVDHYLGKELVSNIHLARFTNRVLEPFWCRDHVENIQIVLEESLLVGDRAGFYDHYGALKDMVQNHMLQLTALTAMNTPKKLYGDFVRDKKLEVLKKIKVEDIMLGQYKSYLKNPEVSNNSKTPTFAALKLSINMDRWKGIPIFLKTGKALHQTKAVIYLKLKKVDCLLPELCPEDTNYIIINLKTNEGIAIELNSKIPDQEEVEPVKLEFRTKNKYGLNTPEAYENIFDEILAGNQYIFVRNDEIEQSWKIIDQVINKKPKLYSYKKGTEGPKEFKQWSKKNKVRWRT